MSANRWHWDKTFTQMQKCIALAVPQKNGLDKIVWHNRIHVARTFTQ